MYSIGLRYSLYIMCVFEAGEEDLLFAMSLRRKRLADRRKLSTRDRLRQEISRVCSLADVKLYSRLDMMETCEPLNLCSPPTDIYSKHSLKTAFRPKLGRYAGHNTDRTGVGPLTRGQTRATLNILCVRLLVSIDRRWALLDLTELQRFAMDLCDGHCWMVSSGPVGATGLRRISREAGGDQRWTAVDTAGHWILGFRAYNSPRPECTQTPVNQAFLI